ncbi:uncharacterized protein LOC109858671 [Pseudomyrmex gracilis]|uniref:uncharacterized protein LOC109858671 n=1 Tax=Pseudomyrmex gracilis TaxID=219809 RepID=UPI000995BDDE|nr:uncharacterized protein LOC109858671 [Pseudomyrmex gracilis]
MKFVKSRYYNLNRIGMIFVGVWPYRKGKFVYIQKVLFFGIFGCFLASQVKQCLERIEHDWATLNGKEFEIVKEYANISRFFTLAFLFTILVVGCCIPIVQFLPVILNVIFPSQTPRPFSRRLIIRMEFLIDEEKYFFAILFYGAVGWTIGSVAIVSIGCSILTFGYHTCAMFKIACYRMERAMEGCDGFDITTQNTIRNGIISALNIHREAIKFADIVQSNFMTFYFFIIVACVASLVQALYSHSLEEIFTTVSYISTLFMYMFWTNYAAQLITDHFDQIFTATYGCPWYMTSVQIQKLIVFILQRGTQPYARHIFSAFTLSLEGFATLVSASMSYFSVIYAAQ